jgi:hypothetical protein
MESTYEWNWSLLIDTCKASSIYLNVDLKATTRGLSSSAEVFEWILLHKDMKINQLTKGHNWYPWGFHLIHLASIFDLKCIMWTNESISIKGICLVPPVKISIAPWTLFMLALLQLSVLYMLIQSG